MEASKKLESPDSVWGLRHPTAGPVLAPRAELASLASKTANDRTKAPSHPKDRTFRACDRCRVKKRKCGGGWLCRGCAADQEECLYSDNKRERDLR
jgi:hypothetical protein